MRKVLALTLGVLTAIGGFVDIGDLVTNAAVGSRFGLRLAWVVAVGIVGISLFAEMSGRIAAISGRPTFDLIRERLGPRTGLIALLGSFAVSWLTMAAEIGGIVLVLELVTGVNHLVFVPLAGLAVWLVVWRVKFQRMEQVFGLVGLLMLTFLVAVVAGGPDWSSLAADAASITPPPSEGWGTYWFYAVALFGAAMTPYEVFFFSSGGVEEGWTKKDLSTVRINTWVGFPLGGLLSLAVAASAAIVLRPQGIRVESLGQVVLPVATNLGMVGLGVVLVGIFAAVSGAALETCLSSGYAIAQYFGWSWGKMVRPRQAPRFHVLVMVIVLGSVLLLMTGVDPVKVTEYSVVFSAVALPLTYLPILVIANDRDYVGDHTNSRITNVLGVVYLVVVCAASLAAIPLLLITGAGS